jgi:transporter family-2 protein
MQNVSAAWLYPVILVCGALQAWGPPMNGALRGALSNPWLASIVSFLPIVFLLAILFFCLPRPLPTGEGLQNMPWWAPLGGLAGAFGGLTITANILMSLAVDHFGWFGIEQHGINLWRVVGGALMVAGIALIAIF